MNMNEIINEFHEFFGLLQVSSTKNKFIRFRAMIEIKTYYPLLFPLDAKIMIYMTGF